jgi:hypothetical protein
MGAEKSMSMLSSGVTLDARHIRGQRQPELLSIGPMQSSRAEHPEVGHGWQCGNWLTDNPSLRNAWNLHATDRVMHVGGQPCGDIPAPPRPRSLALGTLVAYHHA